MLSFFRSVLALVLVGVFAGCAQYSDKRGVEVTWQPAVMKQMHKGETTRREVLTRLGPPSQVISLGDETVLYYLFEKSAGEGLILIVYNRFNVLTQYDRAVFFFDENNILTEFSSQISADPNPEVEVGA
jgi:outer membrane protein assembly factor BamE (lipoprotein component of BamABCDE complex)